MRFKQALWFAVGDAHGNGRHVVADGVGKAGGRERSYARVVRPDVRFGHDDDGFTSFQLVIDGFVEVPKSREVVGYGQRAQHFGEHAHHRHAHCVGVTHDIASSRRDDVDQRERAVERIDVVAEHHAATLDLS